MRLFNTEYLVIVITLPFLFLISSCSQVNIEDEEKDEVWFNQRNNSRLSISDSHVEFEILDADDFGNDTLVKYSASILQRIIENDNVILIIKDGLGNYNFINYCRLNNDTIYTDLRATLSMQNSYKSKDALLDLIYNENPTKIENWCSEEFNDLYVRVR